MSSKNTVGRDGTDVGVGGLDHEAYGKVSLRALKLVAAANAVLVALKTWSIGRDQSRDLPGP